MTQRDGSNFRQGVEYAPGIYSWRGALHIDEDEFIRGAHGNPASPRDRETARNALRKIGAHYGIPVTEVANAKS